jgi:4-hydroxyphenylacetate decarboxylase small subunit
MSAKQQLHRDCRNFAPLDVVKGLCHRCKELVQADAEACREIETLPRCRSCAHFGADTKPHLGICRAEPHHPMTYPDLVAVTCSWYRPAPGEQR